MALKYVSTDPDVLSNFMSNQKDDSGNISFSEVVEDDDQEVKVPTHRDSFVAIGLSSYRK